MENVMNKKPQLIRSNLGVARGVWGKLNDTRQLPVIEQALETSALMLGGDKSRGYCLEMICADFLAGANMEGANPETLSCSLRRVFELLPREQQNHFLGEITSTSCQD